MLKYMRWVKGYVEVDVKGVYPERFLNLMYRQNVSMWQPIGKRGSMNVKVVAKEYKKLRKLSKKANVKIKIVKKVGLPFYIKKNKDRKGLLVGAICFLVLINILSQFVWNIEIPKLENLNEVEVREILKDNGLSSGVNKNNLDIQNITRNTILDLGKVGWMSINVTGVTADIEISESYVAPDLTPEEKKYNIKSDKDAQIVRMETKKGEAVVKVGDAVTKGQLLVSGIVTNEDGEIKIVHSEADIKAKVMYETEIIVEYEQKEVLPTGYEVVREELRFFGIRIPKELSFIPSENYIKQTKLDEVVINNEELPIDIYTENWYEFEEQNIKISKDEAVKEAEKRLALYEVFNFMDSQIESREIKIIEEENSIKFIANYVCIENIGEKHEIEVE